MTACAGCCWGKLRDRKLSAFQFTGKTYRLAVLIRQHAIREGTSASTGKLLVAFFSYACNVSNAFP